MRPSQRAGQADGGIMFDLISFSAAIEDNRQWHHQL